MSLERKDPQIEEDMKDMKLSKYGFGFKLTSFTAMLGWIGMIASVATGIGGLSLFTILIDDERAMGRICYSARDGGLACGLMIGGGFFLVLASPVWFYLSFQLRKKVQEHDLVGITKILKIICYIQGAFSILFSGPLMVFPIICIMGIVLRRTKFVKIYIIYTFVMVILFKLVVVIGYVIVAVSADFGSYFLFGILEAFGFDLLFVYANGFIITLHTIMEHNDNKFTVFKNKHNDFENPIQNK